LLTAAIETIGTPLGPGSTSFTSGPLASMGADLTQVRPGVLRTRQSAQIAMLTSPYHGARDFYGDATGDGRQCRSPDGRAHRHT
jgi:hypothetical protein